MELSNLDSVFAALARSKFRSRFKLTDRDLAYLRDKGLSEIERHAYDFVKKRLAVAFPANDGRQTPMKNHPVFTAQHATATCCRKCLAKWHNIEKGGELTEKQVRYVIVVIMRWLKKQIED